MSRSTVPLPPIRRSLLFALLAALVLATFYPALENGFVWDDFTFIVNNRLLDDYRNLPQIFQDSDAAGTGGNNPYYRPVTTATFLVDKLLWGQRAAGFHATNLVLHLAASLLLLLLLLRMATPGVSFAAAAVFAVHPAHAEPVAYISARADILCGVFLLASFLLYLRHDESGSRKHLLLSTLIFVLALFSKIVAVFLPLMIALHLLSSGTLKRRWPILLPYGAVVGAFVLLRSSVLVVEQWVAIPIGQRLSTSGTILLKQFLHTWLPFNLKILYDVPLRTTFAEPEVSLSWLCLAAIVALGLLAVSRHPEAIAGCAWYAMALLPASGIVAVLYPTAVSDRYLYIPLMGGAMVLAVAGDRLRRHRPTGVIGNRAYLLLAIPLITAAVFTHSRIPAWRDQLVLWRAASADAPGLWQPLWNYALAANNAGRSEECKNALLRAKAAGWDQKELHALLATVYYRDCNFAAAESEISEALRHEADNGSFWSSLALIRFDNGDYPGSRAAAQSLLELEPSNGWAMSMLSLSAAQTPDNLR